MLVVEREVGRESERERERGREREKPISCLPNVPPPRIKPTTFWCTGRCSNQLSHPARELAETSCRLFTKEDLGWRRKGNSKC